MNSDIDLVYFWVDGNDKAWLEKKALYQNKSIKSSSLLGRYEENNELKYSLRSVEKHIPWVRKIFIVTDSQIPRYLNINHPKIEIINHKQIMPSDILPTFNSAVIDHFIHNIPGLSEKFLLNNDDFFFNKNLSPEFFFRDGLPIIRQLESKKFFWQTRKKIFKRKYVCTYHRGILRASTLVKRKLGKRFKLRPHHNTDAYLKSDYKNAYELFKKQIKPTTFNRFRKNNNIQRVLYDFYALAIGKGVLEYPKDSTSLLLSVQDENIETLLNQHNPSLFCLNDNEYVKDEDRKKIIPFLEILFPHKSSFEI